MALLDTSDPEHAHADERLRSEIIAWLTTISADGQPQSTPVWFLWDGESFLVYSRPDKPKIRNIAVNPRVSLHLQSTDEGEEVVTVEGTAEIARDVPPADQVPEYVDKYRGAIAGLGMTPASFARDYSEPLRIRASRIRTF